MKRQIINIDQNRCNGCGLCVPNCPEGAIQIIDGKARLISDMFCDGLGACIGHCPEEAILIEEREAEPYDEKKVMVNIVAQGTNTIIAHLKHLNDHGETTFLNQAIEYLNHNSIDVPDYKTSHTHQSGCPGSKTIDLKKTDYNSNQSQNVKIGSELSQWPIQLHLIDPQAPYFENAELVVAADCVAFSYGNFHQRFLKGKKLVVFCPKLDNSNERYVDKLTDLFKNRNIKSVTTLHMEVPCCGGVNYIVEKAIQNAGKNIVMRDYMISLNGEII